MMKPFITVYIPTYNGEKYIKDCLDSVLGQTFQDFEIVICDDRSSDGTVAIIKEYARRDSRIVFFQNEVNLGCINNHKRCISYARGEWIKPLNHDDFLRPNCLEEMIKQTSLGIPIISCRRDFLFAEDVNKLTGKVFKFIHVDDLFPNKTTFSPEEISCAAIDYLGENFIGEPTAVMIKRDMFFRLDSLNPYMLMLGDLEYWLRVSSNMGLVYIPKVLVSFRIHNNSITGQRINTHRLKPMFDQIILLHEFSFSPVYANLRKVLSKQRPRIDLEDLLSWSLRRRYKSLMRGEGGLIGEGKNAWNELLCNYPALKGVLKKSPIGMCLKKVVRFCIK